LGEFLLDAETREARPDPAERVNVEGVSTCGASVVVFVCSVIGLGSPSAGKGDPAVEPLRSP
jgi:hypothetical protein